MTPADLATGPAGTMVRVREDAATGRKYHETPVASDLETFLEHYCGAYSPEVQRWAREGVEWL